MYVLYTYIYIYIYIYRLENHVPLATGSPTIKVLLLATLKGKQFVINQSLE